MASRPVDAGSPPRMTPTPAGGGKRDLTWNGYKLHISGTCDLDTADTPTGLADYVPDAPPNLITNVATTDASVPDTVMTEPIHQDLARCGLLPAEHYVDSGYPSADLLVSSLTRYGIALVTPMLADTSPQARAGEGFDRTAFTVDWDTRQVTCPQHQTNTSWTPASQRGTEVIVVRFAGYVCQPCPVKAQCTTSTGRGRQLTLRPQAVQQALDHARTEQTTKIWQDKYALRTGVESTIAQSVKVADTRHARYRGMPKPTSNTSSKPSPSTSSALTPGGTATPSTHAEPAISHASNSPSQREPELTSGVRRGCAGAAAAAAAVTSASSAYTFPSGAGRTSTGERPSPARTRPQR
jgi:hypothetical protein